MNKNVIIAIILVVAAGGYYQYSYKPAQEAAAVAAQAAADAAAAEAAAAEKAAADAAAAEKLQLTLPPQKPLLHLLPWMPQWPLWIRLLTTPPKSPL